ncbi:MAG: spore photoproduct lyase family protein [Planctomycetota bacterium]
MIDRIYVEDDVRDHPRTREVLERFSHAAVIPCERYGEVFNRAAQNFRLQKRKPALILARKFENFVLETPAGYGIGDQKNYYFSHMLNCLYDCRYCFLQGMYRSANYVLFVNFEDFADAIRNQVKADEGVPATYFSGYDCDSMVFESITGFARMFVPLFAELPHAQLELRTKSVQTKLFQELPVVEGVVVACSLTPTETAAQLEHGAPPVAARIKALARIAQLGWAVGLRFDPLIYTRDYRDQYRRLMDEVFAAIPAASVHSASWGALRYPKGMLDRITRLYPDEPLFAGALQGKQATGSYPPDVEVEIVDYVRGLLHERMDANRLCPCG